MAQEKLSWGERFISFVTLWISRIALAVLAVAGMLFFLSSVDPVIGWPIAVGTVALLLKETL